MQIPKAWVITTPWSTQLRRRPNPSATLRQMYDSILLEVPARRPSQDSTSTPPKTAIYPKGQNKNFEVTSLVV